jgi:Domain of unknown function (DUF5624)
LPCPTSPTPLLPACFTREPDSIGTLLTDLMKDRSADAPLLVSTASDIALFPGAGAPGQIESFRKSTKGFIELSAVSHVPLAVCYIAQMRDLRPGVSVRPQLEFLIGHAQKVRAANTEAMWRDHVALRAFSGVERKIVDMVEYTLARSVDYMQRAIEDESLLSFENLQQNYLDPAKSVLPVSMNDIMFATFCLAYLDIAYRIGTWLGELNIDWSKAMVLVSGQSGRPTAGSTWSSNNMCNLIWKSSKGALPADRLYVAPHAPGFSVEKLPDAVGLLQLEKDYRHLWCNTRASVDPSRKMFAGVRPFEFSPADMQDMPIINSIDDHAACVARLRRLMEDPQQLLSNCVADYIVDQLQKNGNRPEAVPILGFSNAISAQKRQLTQASRADLW